MDPLGLIASGSLLVMVDPADRENVMRSIRKAGITIECIGKITRKDEGVRIRRRDGIRELRMFERDEIAKILERP